MNDLGNKRMNFGGNVIPLKQIEFSVQEILDRHTIEMKVEYLRDILNDKIYQHVMKITAFVFAHRKTVSKNIYFNHTFFFPATWWQHLKRDHFPAWYLKKWPVKYTPFQKTENREVKFTKDHILDCPQALKRFAAEHNGEIYVHEHIDVSDSNMWPETKEARRMKVRPDKINYINENKGDLT